MEHGKEISTFDELISQAKSDGRPVMIDFYADWCAACKELDHKTFPQQSVIGEADRFVTIKVDATHEEEFLDALYERYGVQGLPTVAFIDSGGELMRIRKSPAS